VSGSHKQRTQMKFELNLMPLPEKWKVVSFDELVQIKSMGQK